MNMKEPANYQYHSPATMKRLAHTHTRTHAHTRTRTEREREKGGREAREGAAAAEELKKKTHTHTHNAKRERKRGEIEDTHTHTNNKDVKVYMDISIGGHTGKLIFRLFNHLTPKTCENYRALCTGVCAYIYLFACI